jgi:hypothetical protein
MFFFQSTASDLSKWYVSKVDIKCTSVTPPVATCDRSFFLNSGLFPFAKYEFRVNGQTEFHFSWQKTTNLQKPTKTKPKPSISSLPASSHVQSTIQYHTSNQQQKVWVVLLSCFHDEIFYHFPVFFYGPVVTMTIEVFIFCEILCVFPHLVVVSLWVLIVCSFWSSFPWHFALQCSHNYVMVA